MKSLAALLGAHLYKMELNETQVIRGNESQRHFVSLLSFFTRPQKKQEINCQGKQT